MKINKNFIWYFCTDENLISDDQYCDVINRVIKCGFKFIQLRFKNKSKKEIIKISKQVQKITNKYEDVKLIINDYWKIARKIQADGVHVGQDDIDIKKIRKKMKNKIIGVSCTNIKQAKKAEQDGANYLGIGAIYYSNTKKDATVIGIKTLKEIIKNVQIPTIAIGNINIDNILDVINSDVSGVAIISYLLKNNKIEDNYLKLLNKINLD